MTVRHVFVWQVAEGCDGAKVIDVLTDQECAAAGVSRREDDWLPGRRTPALPLSA